MVSNKNILKLTLLLLLVFVFIPENSTAANKVKIGIVDLDRAGRESKRGKEIVETMKRRIKKEQEIVKKKEEKVKELRKSLNKQGLIMSEDLRRKKQADFRTEYRSLQRHIKDSEEEMKIKQRDARNKILSELLEITRGIGKKEGYTFITSTEFTIYNDKTIDITDQVIRGYNKKYRRKKLSK